MRKYLFAVIVLLMFASSLEAQCKRGEQLRTLDRIGPTKW